MSGINTVVSGGPVEIETSQVQFVGPQVLVGNAAGQVGFYGTAPIDKQTGVLVTAAGIHAALVALGLIAA